MSRFWHLLGALLVVMTAGVQLSVAEDVVDIARREVAKSIELTDLQGVVHRPLDPQGHTAIVLFFVLPDCPISNAYAPEIKRICADYAKQNVATYLVYVDRELTKEDAQKHSQDYGYDGPVLRDTDLQLVKQTGVKIAPEVAVLDSDGQLVYRGRIDDLYADYGKRRVQPNQRDLRNALDALLAGRPIAQPTTKAIGCFISK